MQARDILGIFGVLLALVVILAFSVVGCEDEGPRRFCGIEGCLDGGDGDVDGDVDADADTDGDGDTDVAGDTDADADETPNEDADMTPDADADETTSGPTTHCSADSDCVLSVNYLLCCACPEARTNSLVDWNPCMYRTTELPEERPEGCNWSCDDSVCADCIAPSGVACFQNECVTTYAGDCRIDTDCGDGFLCELVDGSSRCVEDPNECDTDADCPGGQTCRDWFGDGYRTCAHPDSECRTHGECDYNEFCEDGDGDGIFTCVDRHPACRPGRDVDDCGAGMTCVDSDGDGYGECRVS